MSDQGPLRHLETSFRQGVATLVSRNPRRANLKIGTLTVNCGPMFDFSSAS